MSKEMNDKLIKIQTELKAPKNQFNSFGKYRYRNIEDIQEAVKPLLKEHGVSLVFRDKVCNVGDMYFIESTATLSDGKYEVSSTASAGVESRKGMDLAQSFGASSSYARKYAVGGLLLLDDTKDADATNTHGKDDLPKKPIKKSDAVVINKGLNKLIDSSQIKRAASSWGDESKRPVIEAWLAQHTFTSEHWKAITGTDWAGGDTFAV